MAAIDIMKKQRNFCIKNNIPYEVVLDNMSLAESHGDFILWDDTNECVIYIHKNSKRGQSSNPVEMTISGYEHLQHFRALIPMDIFEEDVNTVVDSGAYTPAQLEAMKKYFNALGKDESYMNVLKHEYTDKK